MAYMHFDRTVSKAQSAKEASDHRRYYANLTWQERLSIAAYLISIAYRYDVHNPPSLDRTIFGARSLST